MLRSNRRGWLLRNHLLSVPTSYTWHMSTYHYGRSWISVLDHVPTIFLSLKNFCPHRKPSIISHRLTLFFIFCGKLKNWSPSVVLIDLHDWIATPISSKCVITAVDKELNIAESKYKRIVAVSVNPIMSTIFSKVAVVVALFLSQSSGFSLIAVNRVSRVRFSSLKPVRSPFCSLPVLMMPSSLIFIHL